MSTNHDRHHNGGQEERINELKQKAEQVSGGKMIAWESEALSPEQKMQFWQQVVEYETAPTASMFQQLTEAGLELPGPDVMHDQELTSKLWEVIGALARAHIFVGETNHLSDRELYTLLWSDVLREETPMLPDSVGSAWHVDLLRASRKINA